MYEDECSICLDSKKNFFNKWKTLSCGHEFHRKCIKKIKNNCCPLCRNYISDTYKVIPMNFMPLCIIKIPKLTFYNKFMFLLGKRIFFSDIRKLRTINQILIIGFEYDTIYINCLRQEMSVELFNRIKLKIKSLKRTISTV